MAQRMFDVLFYMADNFVKTEVKSDVHRIEI